MNLSKNYDKGYVRKSYTNATKEREYDLPHVHFDNKSFYDINATKQYTPKATAGTGFHHHHHSSLSMAKYNGEDSVSKRDYETLRQPKEGSRLLENRCTSTIKKDQVNNKSKSNLLDKSKIMLDSVLSPTSN